MIFKGATLGVIISCVSGLVQGKIPFVVASKSFFSILYNLDDFSSNV